MVKEEGQGAQSKHQKGLQKTSSAYDACYTNGI